MLMLRLAHQSRFAIVPLAGAGLRQGEPVAVARKAQALRTSKAQFRQKADFGQHAIPATTNRE